MFNTTYIFFLQLYILGAVNSTFFFKGGLKNEYIYIYIYIYIKSGKEEPIIKVPLLWVMKGSYFGFGSPQQQVDIHARSKNTFIVL